MYLWVYFHLERSSSEKHLSVVDLSLGSGPIEGTAAGHFLCFTLFFFFFKFLYTLIGEERKKKERSRPVYKKEGEKRSKEVNLFPK